jgi:hypothetical protein
MDDEEIVQRLKGRGYTLGDAAVREDGMFLWRVNDTFMFRQDAIDLASGAATLGDIFERNAGKVFPDAPRVLTAYQEFEGRMFRELADRERAHTRKIVEDLVKVAHARGLSIDDLVRELDAGRGVDGVFQLLKGKSQ